MGSGEPIFITLEIYSRMYEFLRNLNFWEKSKQSWDPTRRRPGDGNVDKLIDAIRNGKIEFKTRPG